MAISSHRTTDDDLGAWQKKQAAMLYFFSSLDYLKGLHKMVSALMEGFVDPLLVVAMTQNRDSVMKDPRWGIRNTVENWSNNAWPFLKDFQTSLAKDIAGRAVERYQITAANECLRGVTEFSMLWATEDEEQKFNEIVKAISEYASDIDDTLNDYFDSRWTDSTFAYTYRKFAVCHKQIPKFRIRRDIVGESGKTPSRTGVYIAQDDPNASLQFAWTGNGGGKLRPAQTFNEIGLAALKEIGRNELWFDDEKMFQFAMRSPHVELFRPTIYMQGEEHRDFAALALSQNVFLQRSCKWFFVEVINGEFEDLELVEDDLLQRSKAERVAGGELVRITGFYFTPAKVGERRRFVSGDKAPEFESQYGKTIWQWDSNQQ